MSQPVQIQLKDTRDWLSRETRPLVDPLKDKATGLLNEIKDRIDDTLQSSQRILENSQGEMNKNNPKTYRFARNATKFADNVSHTLQGITIPDNFDYQRLHTLHGDLERALASLEQLRRSAYPYISPYFIFDRRRLDVSYKRLSDIIKDLRNFLSTKYDKAKDVEDTQSIIDKLTSTINHTEQNKQNIRLIEERKSAVEKQIADTRREIGQVQAKEELKELAGLNQRMEELRQKVKHNLRYLQKPFYKLESLTRTGQVAVPLDEMNKLRDYLGKPFLALATEDDGYLTLKSILRKLDSAMAQGKLKLKSTRLRKAQDQIDAILIKDSLSQLHKDCHETLVQRKQLLATGGIRKHQNQLKQLQNQLRELQKEEELVNSQNKARTDEQVKLQERVEQLRNELEKSIAQLTNKRVHIILAQ